MSSQPLNTEVVDPSASAPRSVVDQIKAKKARKSRRLTMKIPAWDGSLFAEYRRLTPKEVGLATNSGKPAIANANILATACIEVFAIDPDSGESRPVRELIGAEGTTPVRFDGQLADAFGVEGDTPAKIVLGFYEDNLAVGAHAQKLLDWQTGSELDHVSDDELEELAGED